MNAVLVLHLETQVEELLGAHVHVPAALAYGHRAGLATEHVLQQVLLRRVPEGVLNAVEGDVEELLGVLLLAHVRRPPIEVLVGEAEFAGVVVRPLRQLEEGHQLHQLVQHVIVYLIALEVH